MDERNSLKGKYYVKSIYLILIDGGRIVLLRISDWTHDLLYTMHHSLFIQKYLNSVFFFHGYL